MGVMYDTKVKILSDIDFCCKEMKDSIFAEESVSLETKKIAANIFDSYTKTIKEIIKTDFQKKQL